MTMSTYFLKLCLIWLCLFYIHISIFSLFYFKFIFLQFNLEIFLTTNKNTSFFNIEGTLFTFLFCALCLIALPSLHLERSNSCVSSSFSLLFVRACSPSVHDHPCMLSSVFFISFLVNCLKYWCFFAPSIAFVDPHDHLVTFHIVLLRATSS